METQKYSKYRKEQEDIWDMVKSLSIHNFSPKKEGEIKWSITPLFGVIMAKNFPKVTNENKLQIQEVQ